MKCYDLSLFNALSLHLSYLEFASRSKVKSQKGFYLQDSNMPLISSECPGWVCYAEKRCGELAVPHMSRVKSA
jgi:iron only hydrogenase large subunit-like protein